MPPYLCVSSVLRSGVSPASVRCRRSCLSWIFITLSQKESVLPSVLHSWCRTDKTCPFRPGTALFQLAQQRHDGGCSGQRAVSQRRMRGPRPMVLAPACPAAAASSRGQSRPLPRSSRPMRSCRPSDRAPAPVSGAAAHRRTHSRTTPGHTGQRCGTPPQKLGSGSATSGSTPRPHCLAASSAMRL